MGGGFAENANCVTTDASNNIYVVGKFGSSTVMFGTTTLTNASMFHSDLFIAKYDPSGNVIWAKRAGGALDEEAWGVACDATGNVYVTGTYTSTSMVIGSPTLTNTTNESSIFLAKYDPNGNVIWAKGCAGPVSNPCTPYSLTTDNSGNVFITGFFSGGTISFDTVTASAGPNWSTFIVKFNSSGAGLWTKTSGGTAGAVSYSVTTDIGGNSYITGLYTGTNVVFDTTTLTNAGNGNAFITKYSPAGKVLWAKTEGGTGSDWGTGVCTDAAGNVYAVGYFSSPSFVFGTTTLTNVGSNDIYVSKFSSAGSVIWAQSIGGAESDEAYSVSTDAAGNAYVAGYFQSVSITFGTTTD